MSEFLEPWNVEIFGASVSDRLECPIIFLGQFKAQNGVPPFNSSSTCGHLLLFAVQIMAHQKHIIKGTIWTMKSKLIALYARIAPWALQFRLRCKGKTMALCRLRVPTCTYHFLLRFTQLLSFFFLFFLWLWQRWIDSQSAAAATCLLIDIHLANTCCYRQKLLHFTTICMHTRVRHIYVDN